MIKEVNMGKMLKAWKRKAAIKKAQSATKGQIKCFT